jgi:YesN/AraC family two-component response regulator
MTLNKMTLLFVEDDGETRMLFKSLLEKHLKDIYVAKDGEEGWKIYQEKSPDMVLTDIYMPKMNGLELAEKIRMTNRSKPILFLSAHSDAKTLLQAINLNVDGFISKPLMDFDELLERLRKISENLLKKRETSKTQAERMDRLHNMAYIDHLTKALNRFAFQENLLDVVRRSE